jgi:S-adenosylmethionine decarboxylase
MGNLFFKHKGTHIFADYSGIYGDEVEVGNFIFETMIKAIETTNMKIVHKKLCILNGDTPPGFTSILLLDESHFSVHSYTELGLLCADIFTCGGTNTMEIMKYFNEEMSVKFPGFKCLNLEKHKRFRYRKLNILKTSKRDLII